MDFKQNKDGSVKIIGTRQEFESVNRGLFLLLGSLPKSLPKPKEVVKPDGRK